MLYIYKTCYLFLLYYISILILTKISCELLRIKMKSILRLREYLNSKSMKVLLSSKSDNNSTITWPVTVVSFSRGHN